MEMENHEEKQQIESDDDYWDLTITPEEDSSEYDFGFSWIKF